LDTFLFTQLNLRILDQRDVKIYLHERDNATNRPSFNNIQSNMIESLIGKIVSALAVPFIFIGSFFAPEPEIVQVPVYTEIPVYVEAPDDELGVALPQVAAVFETSLASPITAAATTMTLTANSVRGGGSVSGFNCFTIDEGSAQAEFVCGTASGTAITGLTRGISPLDGVTEDTDLQFAHRRGSNVKITDFPLIQRIKSQNNGEGTFENPITYATGVGPVGTSDLADKEYVLSVVSGGTVSFDKEIVAATAGETVAAGNLLYLQNTDAEWYKVDTDTEATVKGRLLAIAQGAGTNGNSITGGVLLSGLDTNQSGLSTGAYYYAGSSAGVISSTASARIVGQARTATNLYFSPAGISSSTPSLRYSNTYTAANTFSATTTFSRPINNLKQQQVFTASSTFTVPSGISYVWVEVIGGGAGGGNATNNYGAGGGGGAYCSGPVNVSATSSIRVTIGAGGASDTSGGATSFSSFVIAGGGTSNDVSVGLGGDCSGSATGLLEIEDFDGSVFRFDDGSTPNLYISGSGGDNVYGSGGAGVVGSLTGGGSAVPGRNGSGYGAGGSGSIDESEVSGSGTKGLVIVKW
jgi:hypothetical protein